ncbi:hypothetical protein [Mycolicibacterium baixiangningiae]|uniref:hypothetical protein n=1 Tax=Mycolicibacterium baixiangningiae TaxID=2761578 RepID=UPI0018D07A3A|nr:hypothetical protein [Mycolicibacterium baixiangningiae]
MSEQRSGRTTHVLKYNGGTFSIELGARSEKQTFLEPLSRFNGEKPWALTLVPLPEGMSYDEVLNRKLEETRFLQAGGNADRMTIEIRQPGGQQWGVESVWSVVGHRSDDGGRELDVPIKLPRSTQMVARSEVFDAEEAADLFMDYYKTGEIPSSYSLRPIGGWTADGAWVDLRSCATS